MVSQYFAEEQEGVLVFGEAPGGRLGAALRRGVMATVLSTLVIGVVLIPDYLFRYREQTPKAGLFALSILLVAAVLGFAFGMARLARSERWILDPAQKVLILERTVFGKPRPSEALDLSHVAQWQVGTATLGQGSSIVVMLQQGQEQPVPLRLIGGWGKRAPVVAVYEKIRSFCKSRKIRMSFDDPS